MKKIEKISIKSRFNLAFRKWLDNTTLHGISYIDDSKSILVKLIWTGIFFFFFGFAIWILSISFSTFFSYAVNTNINRVRKNEIPFPSVTFCNLLYANPKSESLSNELRNTLVELTSDRNVIIIAARAQSTLKFLMYTFTTYFNSLIGSNVKNIGYDINQMLMGCFFMNNDCFATNFKQVISQKYGRCYTFEANKPCKKKYHITLLIYIF